MTILSLALACSAPHATSDDNGLSIQAAPEIQPSSGAFQTLSQGGQPGDIETEIDTADPVEMEERDYGSDLCGEEGVAATIGERKYGWLQDALDQYQPADEALWVCPGVHEGSFQISANYEINIRGASGDSDDALIVSDGGSTFNVFAWRGGKDASPARFVLADVTVVGGVAEKGGAIHVTAQEFVLDGVTVMDGQADFGGGVYVDGDTRAVVVQESSFLANSATRGGAMFIGSPAESEARVVSFDHSEIWSNVASEAGGAIYMDDGGMDAVFQHTNSMLNTAPEGGAYFFSGQEPTDYSTVLISGGGITQTATETGALAAGGVVAVMVEDVDFGDGDSDNSVDVQGCAESFGAGASFFYSVQGGSLCEAN